MPVGAGVTVSEFGTQLNEMIAAHRQVNDR